MGMNCENDRKWSQFLVWIKKKQYEDAYLLDEIAMNLVTVLSVSTQETGLTDDLTIFIQFDKQESLLIVGDMTTNSLRNERD